MPDGLTIQELNFTITRAELSAVLPAPERKLPDGRIFKAGGVGTDLLWTLEIEAAPAPVAAEDGELDEWQPSLGYMPRLNVRHWHEITGQEFRWDKPYDEELGVYNGYLYLDENCELPHATLRFGARAGTGFALDWQGAADILWEQYGEGVPFHLQTTVTFSGIKVYGYEDANEAALRARLAQVMHLDDLQPETIQVSGRYGGGVAVTNLRFVPVG